MLPVAGYRLPAGNREPGTGNLCLGLLLGSALLDEISERGDGAEVLSRRALIFHTDPELALEHYHDFQRIDRVESQPAGEERLVVADVFRSHVLELQSFDQQFF